MTLPGTPKTSKNAEKHRKMLFEFGGRFFELFFYQFAKVGGRLAAGAGPSGGRVGFASQLCRGLGLHIQHALLPLTEVRRILRLRPCRRPPLTAAGLLAAGLLACNLLVGLLAGWLSDWLAAGLLPADFDWQDMRDWQGAGPK